MVIGIGRLCAAFGALLLGHGMAIAQESAVVQAGKRTAIGAFALYSPVECAAMATPETRIAARPQNGTVEIVSERRVVSGPQCKPFQMPVQVIYYTPKAGFRGSDSVSVDFFYQAFVEAPRSASQRQSYSITVR